MTVEQALNILQLYKVSIPEIKMGYICHDASNTELVTFFLDKGNPLSLSLQDRILKAPIPGDAQTIFFVNATMIRLVTNSFEEALLFLPIFKHYTV